MIVRAGETAEREMLLAYLASKMGTSATAMIGQMPYEIVATVGADGKPNGAVLYVNYRDTSIEMACAGESGWLTRANLRDLFQYPFEQLGCWTVMTVVKRSNEKARAFNTKLGFNVLGVIESGRGKGQDSILYTMTKPQCRWLSADKPDAKAAA